MGSGLRFSYWGPLTQQSQVQVRELSVPIARVEITSEYAVAYVAVSSKLEKAGTPIGPLDTLIAAQAVGAN